MKGKMKAQLFYGPGDVRYENINIPELGMMKHWQGLRAL